MESTQYVFDRHEAAPPLDAQEMAEDMLWYVQGHDWVTYVELQRRYGDQAKGELCIENPTKNVIFWTGMSNLFLDAMDLLHTEKAIHPHAAEFLTYMIDGGLLPLPLVKSGRAYKKPHWFPLCFRPHAACDMKDCPTADSFRGFKAV